MDKKPRILALGNFTGYQYHPFGEVAVALEKILGGAFEVQTTGSAEALNEGGLSSFNLFLSYADAWDKGLSNTQMSNLQNFIADGGGLLAIHCGISFNNQEYQSLLGGRFTGHPPYQKLGFKTKNIHRAIQGISSFSIEDEPYMFEMIEPDKSKIILEFTLENKKFPAGWLRTYKKGRICYLAPGHTAASFEDKMYAQLILNCALWTMNNDH